MEGAKCSKCMYKALPVLGKKRKEKYGAFIVTEDFLHARHYLKKFFLMFISERQRERETGREREGDTESEAGSRL